MKSMHLSEELLLQQDWDKESRIIFRDLEVLSEVEIDRATFGSVPEHLLLCWKCFFNFNDLYSRTIGNHAVPGLNAAAIQV